MHKIIKNYLIKHKISLSNRILEIYQMMRTFTTKKTQCSPAFLDIPL